ncbi:hypothetical protein U1Q18_020295, partial [Sarracenia purpurea var. burkii]
MFPSSSCCTEPNPNSLRAKPCAEHSARILFSYARPGLRRSPHLRSVTKPATSSSSLPKSPLQFPKPVIPCACNFNGFNPCRRFYCFLRWFPQKEIPRKSSNFSSHKNCLYLAPNLPPRSVMALQQGHRTQRRQL